MKKKLRFNLDSPNSIKTPCDLANLSAWFSVEIQAVSDLAVRQVCLDAVSSLEHFVRWPEKALLLWQGRDRRNKYHIYPQVIRNLVKLMATNEKIKSNGGKGRTFGLDSRVNGPAVAAFHVAGGKRPPRYGSRNAWSVHHLYSGKFPYPGRATTLHAAKDGVHFTQSAGLVAIHPIADQMCDEFPPFAWLLRALSFQKFGYDPDCVFSDENHDQCGFVGKSCTLIPQETTNGEEAKII